MILKIAVAHDKSGLSKAKIHEQSLDLWFEKNPITEADTKAYLEKLKKD